MGVGVGVGVGAGIGIGTGRGGWRWVEGGGGGGGGGESLFELLCFGSNGVSVCFDSKPKKLLLRGYPTQNILCR